MPKFRLFDQRMIITANDDLTIPLNSKMVVELPKGGFQQDLLQEMMVKANAHDELLKSCKELRNQLISMRENAHADGHRFQNETINMSSAAILMADKAIENSWAGLHGEAA